MGRAPARAPEPPTHTDEGDFVGPVEVGPDGIDRRGKPRIHAAAGMRVLVIDDSPTIVALLRRMLQQNGFEVLEAGDAEAGLDIARSGPLHLVFLDIVLPGMNGFEALRRLRREAATRDLPVIMISGNELATEQFYAQRIGADDFMKKPFSRSEVFHRIERLLGPDRLPQRHGAGASATDAGEG
ncbi:response regulator [Chiayiivirga flava]|uniref:Twitching motility two-component system response regulator PilH n=1 Tax=Chiayiivirga flava TaxID=659595 RepID=A0A7W8D5Y5_9GAMM|nr:response regulator [Chiayiivirga flava]MBB5207405.1 twitching motility two-component system response regulator PilH [Chiayiivirga flava]